VEPDYEKAAESVIKTLTAEQSEARRRIEAFLDAPSVERPWFSVHSLAGCGKTVLLGSVAQGRRNSVLCAFSGKAASNLSRKTGLATSTVHGAIYRFLGREIDERGEEDLIFTPHVKNDRWAGQIVLVDEDSTIDERMARDLIDTGARIVTTGDPGQLRPVRGRSFFTDADIMLTEIHRQALDSPIIRQAHAVRQGLDYVADGTDFRVQSHVATEDILLCDVILCWRNATRRALNALKRAHLRIDGPPIPGEPVMCLKNDHGMGVLNGATYELISFEQRGHNIDIGVINERGEYIMLERCWFEDIDEHNRQFDDSIGFTWSYCATVHKFQGSEADFVILVDEYNRSDERMNWLYTGFTRAARHLLVQRSW
jgi:exodeoxyribonuclease V